MWGQSEVSTGQGRVGQDRFHADTAHDAELAQSEEHAHGKGEVTGANPVLGSNVLFSSHRLKVLYTA